MPRELAIVLFSDIVGSTELRSSVGDDEADRTVALHDAAVAEIVPARGGQVVKYLGDGALATFPSAVEATEAAVAIQGRLAESGPAVRIGIHAGDVEVSDGDVAGLPVAVASRLCGVAPSGSVVVSDLVRSLVGVRGDLRFESLGWPPLKGVAEPVEVWIVQRGAAVPNRSVDRLPPARLGRKPAEFVGREHAISTLDRTFANLERQYLIAISGEPGIGKTALVAYWAQRAYDAGTTVLVGSAPPEGVAPYQPFIEAIRPLLSLDESLRPRGRSAANLGRLMPELARTTVGPSVLDDPNTERYMINEAFVDVLSAVADRDGPLVVVLDDLHWADEASIVLISHLLRHSRTVPVLVVGTYRDTDLERRHPLADLLRDQRRARHAERLDLGGLEVDDVASLVAAVAGGAAPDRALDVIVSETAGNPFFVEEIVEHLVAESMVVDGTWDFDPRAALTIPEGIRDTIGRRLDRLSDGAQALLAAASVIGASFKVDLLVEVLGGADVFSEDALEEAVSSGFLVEGGPDISFSHALVRQTIQGEISHLRRSRLHRATGAALASRGASADRLVHHWMEANEYGKALEASAQAMRDAESVAALSAVVAHATTVLELWDEVDPSQRPTGMERHHAIVAAGLAIGVSQGSLEGVEFLRSHRAGLEAAGDSRAVGVVLAEEARHLWPLGRVEEALEAAERAIELIPASPPTSERARADAQLGRLLMLTGTDNPRAMSLARQALEGARESGDSLTETAALVTLGTLETDPADAEATLRRGLEMATSQNAVFQITRVRTNLSELLAGQQRHDEAVELMREGVEVVRRYGGQGQPLGWMVANLAQRQVEAGRWDEAEEILDTAIPTGYPEAIQLLLRARIDGHRGRFDQAHANLARIDDEYSQIDDLQFLVPLTAARLWLARWQGDVAALPSDAFDAVALPDGGSIGGITGLDYLMAVAEAACWAKRQGLAAAGTARFDDWIAFSVGITVQPAGESIAATMRAFRASFDGNDDYELWSSAVRTWPPGSFEHAVGSLGWIRCAPKADPDIAQVSEIAIATAQRLGAEPLLAELRELT